MKGGEETVSSARRRALRASDVPLHAPRSLNDPVRCWCSFLRYRSHPSIALSCVFFVHGVRTTPPGLAAPFGSDDDGTPAATRCLATATSENGTTTGGAAVEGSGGIAVAPGGGDAEAEDDDSNLLARPRDAKRRIVASHCTVT